jgi:taurine dioxygenase
MQVNRLGSTFFAEVVSVNVAHLSDQEFRQIKKAHLEHGVLVFRDQDLTPEEHISFSRRFGPLQVHPMMQFNLEARPRS